LEANFNNKASSVRCHF